MPSTKVLLPERPLEAVRSADRLLAALSLDWGRLLRRAAWVGLVVMASCSFLFVLARFNLPTPSDWRTLALAAADPASPGLYSDAYRWSPVAAWLLAILLPPLPIWIALHVAAALMLRNWRLTLVVLASVPFWEDALSGNVIIFVVTCAFLAIRGSRTAGVVYLALALLMPRPIMLPVLIWLLWNRPGLRLIFASMLVVHTGLVAATGLGGDWIAKLMESSSELGHPENLAPSRLLGTVWLVMGIALSMALGLRGRIGLASIAISPYVFPYYLLFAVLEFAVPAVVGPPRGTHWVPRVAKAFATWLPERALQLRPQRAFALIPIIGSQSRSGGTRLD